MAKTPTRYNELREGLDYTLQVKASPSDEEYTLKFVGSSETPDRHGDIVKSDGWRLDAYKANPVFLWGHDHRQLPIGKAVSVKVNKKEKRLEFKIKFAVEEYAFAATVYKLFKSGFLNATSVGFMVHDWEYDEKEDKFLLTDNELLELSAVTVPANPDALILDHAKGLFDDRDIERMKQEGLFKNVIKSIEKLVADEKQAEVDKIAKDLQDEEDRVAKELQDEEDRVAKELQDEQDRIAAEAKTDKLAKEKANEALVKEVAELTSKLKELTTLVEELIKKTSTNGSDDPEDTDDQDKTIDPDALDGLEPPEDNVLDKIAEMLGIEK